jgi:hypothetical protein
MWRQAVNDVLRRFTGFQLQRASVAAQLDAERRQSQQEVARLTARLKETTARLAGSEDRRTELDSRLRQAEERLTRAKGRLEQTRRQLTKARANARRQERGSRQPKVIPHHYDAAAVEILRRVESRTMTDYGKLFGLVEATRYVLRAGIPGDFVECGVWRGGSMQAVALTLLEQGLTDRDLHLFDTFEGMPPPTDEDRRSDGHSAEELLAVHDKDHRVWAIAGLDDVETAMREVGYPEHRIHFHKGLVEETVPDLAPARIALLRLDTDWYESTRHELEHLYERLSPGGVLIIDDYGDWEGARKATDEFLATLPEPLLLLPIGTGRLAVRPFVSKRPEEAAERTMT